MTKKMQEICNECGVSVKAGDGNFINRVPSCATYSEHKRMNKQYPLGAYMCAECESNYYKNLKESEA